MKLSPLLPALAGLTSAHATLPQPQPQPPSTPQHLFSNPPPTTAPHRIPTSYESAVLARRILALTPLATLSTVFPTAYAAPTEDADGLPHAILLENRPPGLGGLPIGLEDYIADCDAADTGDPTILAISIATSFRNVAAGSNISAALSWKPPHPPAERIKAHSPRRRRWWWSSRTKEQEQDYDPLPYSAANLPRFSLLGYLEPIPAPAPPALERCFLAAHPDAKYWLPGNRIHRSEWVRLVVTQVYWIGGFGDRAYIGWIPVDEWKNVTRREWEAVRLPGEKKGWKEWSSSVSVGIEL